MNFGKEQLRAQYSERLLQRQANETAQRLVAVADSIAQNLAVLEWVVLDAPEEVHVAPADPKGGGFSGLEFQVSRRPFASINLGPDQQNENLRYFADLRQLSGMPLELLFGVVVTEDGVEESSYIDYATNFENRFSDAQTKTELTLMGGTYGWKPASASGQNRLVVVETAAKVLKSREGKLRYLFSKIMDPDLNPEYAERMSLLESQ